MRSETPLGDGALSVAYGALEVARKIFGELSQLKVTIIGAGEVAELVLQNLQGQPTKGLKIINRSRERAEHLAKEHNAQLGGFEELPQALIDSDLVIVSTGASEPVITTEMVRQSQAERKGGALLLVDLGLPTDVEQDAGSLADVFLFNLDDLARLVEGNLQKRREAIPEAEEIVQHEARQFANWLDSRRLDPAIRSLRQALESAGLQELKKMKEELNPEEYERMEKVVRKVINRLLHKSTQELRESSGQLEKGFLSKLESLFQVDPQGEDETP